MWIYLLGAAVVGADRLAKWFVTHHRLDGPLLGDVLRLTLTEKSAAAFGMLAGDRGVGGVRRPVYDPAAVAIGTGAAGLAVLAWRGARRGVGPTRAAPGTR